MVTGSVSGGYGGGGDDDGSGSAGDVLVCSLILVPSASL